MRETVQDERWSMSELTSVEICAGAGGQALGLEQAGFGHELAVEIDASACATLRHNRPGWNVSERDVRDVDGRDYRGIDLFAGGVPCPPFSIAGKQLGADDERDLFPTALRIVRESRPRAVLLENVRGLAGARFEGYRSEIISELDSLGYAVDWRLVYSSHYGVPQLRPRFLLVAMRPDDMARFAWPEPDPRPTTVGDALHSLVAARGWSGADAWRARAQIVAPTIVGGSKKHGGADLGPTRARAAWAQVGVIGSSLAEEAPSPEHPADAPFRLTLEMAAALQGFPADWHFVGRKTAAYRQIGNAFPPPVAKAVGHAIRSAIIRSSNCSGPGERVARGLADGECVEAA